MPNLTFPVGPDRPPVIEVAIAIPEQQAEHLESSGLPKPLPVVASALLDTGSRFSMISRDIADHLGLDQAGAMDIRGVGGRVSVSGKLCVVRLFFASGPAQILAHAATVVAVDNLNHLGARMIIGRDVLSTCVLVYNGPHSSCTFAF